MPELLSAASPTLRPRRCRDTGVAGRVGRALEHVPAGTVWPAKSGSREAGVEHGHHHARITPGHVPGLCRVRLWTRHAPARALTSHSGRGIVRDHSRGWNRRPVAPNHRLAALEPRDRPRPPLGNRHCDRRGVDRALNAASAPRSIVALSGARAGTRPGGVPWPDADAWRRRQPSHQRQAAARRRKLEHVEDPGEVGQTSARCRRRRPCHRATPVPRRYRAVIGPCLPEIPEGSQPPRCRMPHLFAPRSAWWVFPANAVSKISSIGCNGDSRVVDAGTWPTAAAPSTQLVLPREPSRGPMIVGIGRPAARPARGASGNRGRVFGPFWSAGDAAFPQQASGDGSGGLRPR